MSEEGRTHLDRAMRRSGPSPSGAGMMPRRLVEVMSAGATTFVRLPRGQSYPAALRILILVIEVSLPSMSVRLLPFKGRTCGMEAPDEDAVASTVISPDLLREKRM
jgi:hypothetical protein